MFTRFRDKTRDWIQKQALFCEENLNEQFHDEIFHVNLRIINKCKLPVLCLMF